MATPQKTPTAQRLSVELAQIGRDFAALWRYFRTEICPTTDFSLHHTSTGSSGDLAHEGAQA